MYGFQDIAWVPLCAGLTAIGLVLTWLIGRRRGGAAVMRGVAWSLVPIALALTGLIEVAWRTGTAVASWALQLVFSPVVWAGIVVAGLCVLLFVVSGVLRRRGVATGDHERKPAPAGEAPKELQKQPSGAKAPAKDAGPSDDLADVEEILRRRGIT